MPDDPWGEPETALGIETDSIPTSLKRVLREAALNGWALSKTGCTMVARFGKPDDPKALPFFMRWDLRQGASGNLTWRFHSSLAANGQRMNNRDVLAYLADPDLIQPSDPNQEESSDNSATQAERVSELVNRPASVKRWNQLQYERRDAQQSKHE